MILDDDEKKEEVPDDTAGDDVPLVDVIDVPDVAGVTTTINIAQMVLLSMQQQSEWLHAYFEVI
jgi:hypothetical protein